MLSVLFILYYFMDSCDEARERVVDEVVHVSSFTFLTE